MKILYKVLVASMIVVSPIWGTGASVFMALAFLLSLYVILRNRERLPWKKIIPFLIYFSIFSFGGLWSEDRSSASFAVTVRLSMLVVPFVVAAGSLLKVGRDFVFYSAAGAVGLACLFMFIDSMSDLISGLPFEESFAGSQFSLPFIHRAYFMNYIAFVVLGWTFLGESRFPWLSGLGILSVILVFWLLQGRMDILVLMFSLLVTSAIGLFGKNRQVLLKSLSVLFIFGFLYVTDVVPVRFDGSMGTELDMPDEGAPAKLSRSYQWKSALEVYLDHPVLGTGPGDTQAELNAYYEKTGYTFGLIRNYNAHNDYLQTLMAVGPLGLLSLLALLILPFIDGVRNRDFSLIVWIMYFGAVMLSESYFERFHGVFVYSVFSLWLWMTTRRA